MDGAAAYAAEFEKAKRRRRGQGGEEVTTGLQEEAQAAM